MTATGVVADDIERLALVMRTDRWSGAGDTVVRVRAIPEGIVGEELVIDPTGTAQIVTVVSVQDRDITVDTALSADLEPDTSIIRKIFSEYITSGAQMSLAADAAATDTTVTIKSKLTGIAANSGWVVIDPYTTDAEVRKVTAISSNEFTIAALDYAHSENDPVYWIHEPTVNLKWFGATTAADVDTPLARALAQVTGIGGGKLLVSEVYPIGAQIDLVSDLELVGIGQESGFDGSGMGTGTVYFDATSKDNITIRNLKFTGDGNSNHIAIRHCTKVRVEGNWFYDTASTAENVASVKVQYDDSVATAQESRDIEIAGNYFQVTNLCVLTQGRQTGPSMIYNVNIHDNNIDGTRDNGTFGCIKVDVHTFGFQVCRNTINGQGNVEDGIVLTEDIQDGVCAENIVFDCLRYGISLDRGQGELQYDNIVVANNVVRNITGSTNGDSYGIVSRAAAATPSNNIKIANNMVIGAQEYGIGENAAGVVNLSIVGNTVVDSGAQGIRVRSDNVLVNGNQVTGAAAVASLRLESSADGTKISGNDFRQVDGSGNWLSDLGTNTEIDSATKQVGYTIAAGVITLAGTARRHLIVLDTQDGDPTDDLDTINGGSFGDMVIIRSTDNARDPTIKDGTGNLILAGDFILTNTQDTIVLVKFSTGWIEVSRSDNA